ncbi:C10 family peptidase [Paraflavitalea speifideaquila]|uniref:C10 family peptidase n=1 Tax=Paraflavitalea speifideaquila TaxID=3076558 RepID=UPI0033130373
MGRAGPFSSFCSTKISHVKKTIPVLISLLSCVHLQAQQTAAERPGRPYLLKTNWDQYGLYTKYTPNNEVLGCWSTAMAQILYHHRLRPSGLVNYQCSKGFVITDTLDKYALSWTDFSASLDSTSSPGLLKR